MYRQDTAGMDAAAHDLLLDPTAGQSFICLIELKHFKAETDLRFNEIEASINRLGLDMNRDMEAPKKMISAVHSLLSTHFLRYY